MKKKTKKPKDELIDSLLDDLKDQSHEDSFRIGPDGIESSDHEQSDENDRTAVLSLEGESTQHIAEFFVSNEDKTRPMDAAARNMASPPVPKLDSLDEPRENMPASPAANSSKPNSNPNIKQNAKSNLGSNSEPPAPQASAPMQRSSAFDNQFARAENLKMAQQRILELEKDIERYRKENEMLSSANEIAKNRMEDLISKATTLERQKIELKELNESELRIFKDGLVTKDSEIHRLKNKVDELESRLANDLRKVRVRERELENRLELAKVEKTTLLRAKDESILELKRKTENLQAEVENYQNKIIELGQKIEANQEQFARTVRALRLALTNLEVNNENAGTSITLTPMKKAD